MNDKLHLICGISLSMGDCFYEKQYLYKYHLVAIVDDKPDKQIVFKYYGRHKQWWHYEIVPLYRMNEWFRCGLYYTKNKTEVT